MRKLFMTTLAIALMAASSFADDKLSAVADDRAQNPNDLAAYIEAKANHWCATHEIWEMNASRQGVNPNVAACPSYGVCDAPGTRDATPVTPLSINVIVHVIRNDNGTGGVSQATVDATIAEMNADYGGNGTGISFNLVATRYRNNSALASIAAYSPFNTNYQTDINQMKDLYNENPASNLNIYISAQDNSSFGVLLGIATFPWDANALLARGGLWVNNISVGTGAGTATHEIGHCLGLWHTHHGVSEVTSCGTCYEYASGVEGSTRGDFCEDTPPTPTNYNCAAPGGSDCQSTAWGATQPQNYMGYGPDNCYTLFTAKQTLRMQCWTKNSLAGWLGSTTPVAPTAAFSGSPTSGSTPLTVNFTDQSTGIPTSWSWNFGDGGTSTSQNPSHVYNAVGTYTVTLTATNAQGSDGETKTNYITVTTPPVQQCDDFADNNITNWGNSVGTWSAASGIMTGSSNTTNAQRTSPFGSFSAPTISCKVRMNTGRNQRNARLIWSYVNSSNYRYLEADDLNNQWKVVERVNGTNTVRATASGTINTAQWYTVQVAVASNGAISVTIDGTNIGGYAFATAVSGLVGVGFTRSNSNFDDYCVSGTAGFFAGDDVRDLADPTVAADIELPSGFSLDQNYPNPFNPKTLISYRLAQSSNVTLTIYNLLGERVTVLVDGLQSAGEHVVEWDASTVASGIYFYRLESGGVSESKKMLFLK